MKHNSPRDATQALVSDHCFLIGCDCKMLYQLGANYKPRHSHSFRVVNHVKFVCIFQFS